MPSRDPTSGPADYAVNIVYVRDSVDRLLPFLETLLARTDCRYRLVANGCDERERSILRDVALRHPERATYVEGSRDEVLDHGAMLERLLGWEDRPYFVIADSDLLASGPASFEPVLPAPSEGARCSGVPVWQTRSDVVADVSFRKLSGRYVYITGADVVVGCSYAAGYHTDRLRGIVDRWDAPLGRVRRTDLPADLRDRLDEIGMSFEDYDTLKVVNLLHHAEGWPIRMATLDGIVHLGAMSVGRNAAEASGNSLRSALLRRVPLISVLRLRQRGVGWREARIAGRVGSRRQRLRHYLTRLADGETTIRAAPRWLRRSGCLPVLADLYGDPSTAGRGS